MASNIKCERPQNPRINAKFFEIITFSWIIDLFKKGQKRDLDESDLYETLNEHSSSTLVHILEKKWKKELADASTVNRKPSLLRVLINMFGPKFMFHGFLLFLREVICKMSQPIFLGGLLAYFTPSISKEADLGYAYMCALGLVLSMSISVILEHTSYFMMTHLSMKIRVACSSIIFRKALRLSLITLDRTTVGHITNLLSSDMNRINIGLSLLHYIWIGPLQTTVVTYFLWQEVGISSLFGIIILLFVIPSQGWFGKKIFDIRFKVVKWTDDRGRFMNDIIASIQVIKMQTWEKPFAKLVEYARKKEVQHIKGIIFVHAMFFVCNGVLSRFQVFTCILSYVLFGNYISTQKVFVVISFYYLLQPPMTSFFGAGITRAADMLATIQRIQNFLLLNERDGLTNKSNVLTEKCNININDTKNSNEYLEKIGVDILNATATWEDGQNSKTLDNISLRVRCGQFAVIVGPVGAGKSSIMHLILRELPLLEGKVSVRGEISYASQEPWIFPGSIQQNILFASLMNEERYKQVVKSCGLEVDFEQFSHGDRTIVGERGVTLSGGQKSRIHLARAIYKEADIYLLDDPLSAVDSRISKHLFDKCIKGFLKDKTCILITHQLQLLRNEKLIVLMEKSKIKAHGSYQEVLSNTGFEKLGKFPKETNIELDIVQETNPNETVFKDYNTPSVNMSKVNEEKQKSNVLNETRSTGKISKRVYTSYITAFGSYFNIFIFFFMYIITQILTTVGDFWITFWVNEEDYVFQNRNNISNNANTSINDYSIEMFSLKSRQTNIIVYIVLNISLIIAILIRSVVFVTVCKNASLKLHNIMFNSVLRAKMLFFQSNSSGQILNRFSNDIGKVDENLPYLMLEVLHLVFRILGSIFIVVLTRVIFLIPIIIMGIICYYMRSFYLSTSRSIKRLEEVTQSPVLGHTIASIQGLTTIRAYNAEQTTCEEFDKHQDLNSSARYLFISSNVAFGLWIDIACFTYLTVIIISLFIYSDDTNGSTVGLVITQSIGILGMLQHTIIQTTMLENQMISVERVLEYTKCPQEQDNLCLSDKKVPDDWPGSGRIVFKNLSLRYSQNSPYILKNLNFQIFSSEKVGIVGRTGAGKSSIIQALFRLAFNEGEIIIDDVEIHELGLNDLRSKISVIPQDPILYSGTMRYNLDPFDEFPDHVLWNALEEVQLKTTIENLPGSLNSKISENGSNFSVGQKQLICLARALLRKNKILILDEATANIDTETDVLIQNTIRKNFKTSTVLTVAHRLNTIMDSDRVLVMDNGSVIEFDHPHVLLEKKDGLFYSMVEQTGRASVDLLHRVAAENFKAMHKEKK